MPKMSRYVETFKVEDKSNKLITFRIDDEKLLQNIKLLKTTVEDLKILN